MTSYDFRTVTSSSPFPLVSLNLFTWYLAKISYRYEPYQCEIISVAMCRIVILTPARRLFRSWHMVLATLTPYPTISSQKIQDRTTWEFEVTICPFILGLCLCLHACLCDAASENQLLEQFSQEFSVRVCFNCLLHLLKIKTNRDLLALAFTRQLHVSALSSIWFIELTASDVIGQSCYFGCGFTTSMH